jgi:hypothetical protein
MNAGESSMSADKLGNIRTASQRLPKLKWLMVDRDEDATSRIPAHGLSRADHMDIVS